MIELTAKVHRLKYLLFINTNKSHFKVYKYLKDIEQKQVKQYIFFTYKIETNKSDNSSSFIQQNKTYVQFRQSPHISNIWNSSCGILKIVTFFDFYFEMYVWGYFELYFSHRILCQCTVRSRMERKDFTIKYS